MGFNSEHAIGREWLAFDIETVPMPNVDEYLIEPINPPKNYVDPAKKASYVLEKRKEQIENAGLDLDLCEVVCIAVDGSRGSSYVDRRLLDERHMLETFWRWVPGCRLIGFNNRRFDLPILLRRSLYLGVPAPAINLDKYRSDGIVDLSDVLSFGRIDLVRSLAFYAKRLGIPHDDSVKGEQIAQLVAEGRWDDVANHCRADVATTVAIARRLGYVPQDVPAEAVAL